MDADKNLGMVVMKREDYIKSILKEHILQPDIYEQLLCLQVHYKVRQVIIEIKNTVRNSNQELSISDKKLLHSQFSS